MKIKKKCIVCGKELLVPPCLIKRKNYCSVECRRAGVRKKLIKQEKTYCNFCGKELKGKDRLRMKYCNRECMKKAFLIENPSKETARAWSNRNKKSVTCEICGSKENVQMHHPDILNYPRKYQSLCRKCHTQLHIRQGTWGTMRTV